MIDFAYWGFLSDGSQLGFSQPAFDAGYLEKIVHAQELCALKIGGGTSKDYNITVTVGQKTAVLHVRKAANSNTAYVQVNDVLKSGILRSSEGYVFSDNGTACTFDVAALDGNGEEIGVESFTGFKVYDSLKKSHSAALCEVSAMMPDTAVLPNNASLRQFAYFGVKLTDGNKIEVVGNNGNVINSYDESSNYTFKGSGRSIRSKISVIGNSTPVWAVAYMGDGEIERTVFDYRTICGEKELLVCWWSPVDGCYKARIARLVETGTTTERREAVRGFQDSHTVEAGYNARLRFGDMTRRDYSYYRDVIASDEVFIAARSSVVYERFERLDVVVTGGTQSIKADAYLYDFDFEITIKNTDTL